MQIILNNVLFALTSVIGFQTGPRKVLLCVCVSYKLAYEFDYYKQFLCRQ